MLPYVHLLFQPNDSTARCTTAAAPQQRVGWESPAPALPHSLGALLEVADGNKEPAENSGPVCHLLAPGHPDFRLDISAVPERLSVLTFQRNCWAGSLLGHQVFTTNATAHLWIPMAFAIVGNITDSPAKSRGSYQPSCKALQLLLQDTCPLHSSAQSSSRNTVTGGSKTTASYRGLWLPQGTDKRLTLIAVKVGRNFYCVACVCIGQIVWAKQDSRQGAVFALDP